MKIAIVDDSSFSRMHLRAKLKEIQPEVETVDFCDGVEAVKNIPEGGFDLITLDMTMPNKDGFEALVELRELGVTTPIYIITANIQKATKERCLAAGCTGILPKPIDEAESLRPIFDSV